jgi:hypothetical protein
VSALRSLNLGGCSTLEQLPGSLAQLTALSSLDLRGWYGLKQLPKSQGHLTALPPACSCRGQRSVSDGVAKVSVGASLPLRLRVCCGGA